jgi:hypothetical protein
MEVIAPVLLLKDREKSFPLTRMAAVSSVAWRGEDVVSKVGGGAEERISCCSATS